MGNLLSVRPARKDVERQKAQVSDKKSLYVIYAAGICDALESALVWAAGGTTKEPNCYMNGNYGPVEENAPLRAISVKGDIPECLNGEFVRVGPNPKFKPVMNYHCMLHGLRIKDGKATYVSRFVRTARFKQEEYWGGAKFMKIGDLMGKPGLIWANIYKLRVKLGILDLSDGGGTANTALSYHNGRLLSLSEGDKPYAIRVLEDGDLETIGRLDYDKKLNHNFTAHPKLDPVTGEMFTFGYQVDHAPHATYRVVSKDGIMDDPVPITISGPIMMHDFAITENYAIFMDCPLYFNPQDMVAKNQFIFSFDATKLARFGVLPRYAKNEAQIRWFELSTCTIFHNANAWEEGDEVVLISCRLPTIDLGALSVFDEEKSKFVSDLWEYRFNMTTGKAVERKLGTLSDFPRINEAYIGRKSRYVYCALFDDATHIPGVVKYDLTLEPDLSKEKVEVGGNVAGVYWHGNLRYGSEPVYVPKIPGTEVEEDEGYLLNFVHDENTGKSEVVVLDAKTMSSDPVAVIELPARVPFGFHAMFVTEDQLRSQQM